MKSIGIEIDKNRVVLYALELDNDGDINNITGEFKSLTLNDEMNNYQVREFKATLHSFFDDINPDRIGVISLYRKGRFTSSATSFKLEGLIQCYSSIDVEFISSATIAAYYKKQQFNVKTQYSYQEQAAKLANYLIHK